MNSLMNAHLNKSDILISIIIPVFNEEGNIRRLTEKLELVLKPLEYEYEVIFVDDGSRDRTWENILKAGREFQRIKGYRFSRNFGHQKALLAGMKMACGDVVITMDGDLQHPPELVPELISKWETGSKIVNTRRVDSDSTSFFKRMTSEYFYRVFSFLAGFEISKGTSDFRLMDRESLNALLTFGDDELFVRGAVQWLGFSAALVPFSVGERYSGRSKYNIFKMLRFAATGITSFSNKPLRLGIWIGVLTSILAFCELGYIVFRFFSGNTVPGWASTLGFVSLLFGLLFIMLGVIGMYIGNIHSMLQGRPMFIISERTSSLNHNK